MMVILIDYSDIPEMTEAEFQETLAKIKGRTKKVMFSLRLKPETIAGWKVLAGDGYTTVMADILDKLRERPELIRELVK